MLPLEALIFGMVAVAALVVLLGWRPRALAMRIFFLPLLALTIAQIIAEGPHWQVFPLYCAVVLLALIVFAPHAALVHRAYAYRSAGLLILGMALSAAGASSVLPMFHLPQTTGPYEVGTRILYLVDKSRDTLGERTTGSLTGPDAGSSRELMVQVWYPAGPSVNPFAVYRRRAETSLISSYQSVLRTRSRLDAPLLAKGAPWALLLFNPAWTGQRTQSTFLTQELASHGFIVASIDHTWYSGRVAFPDGRVIDDSRAPEIGNFEHSTVDEQLALGAKYSRIEADDDIFVLDQFEQLNGAANSDWRGKVDMTKVGALGHSIGGSVSEEAARLDPRIRAALNMDGWVFGDVLAQGLNKPLMMIIEKGTDLRPSDADLKTAPEAVRRNWQLDDLDNAGVEAGLHRFGGIRLFIDGASHWNFSDHALYSPLRSQSLGGTIDATRAYQIIDRYAVAFFSHALRGTDEAILSQIPGQYPEVDLESYFADRSQ